jgi:hypothetical protein
VADLLKALLAAGMDGHHGEAQNANNHLSLAGGTSGLASDNYKRIVDEKSVSLRGGGTRLFYRALTHLHLLPNA